MCCFEHCLSFLFSAVIIYSRSFNELFNDYRQSSSLLAVYHNLFIRYSYDDITQFTYESEMVNISDIVKTERIYSLIYFSYVFASFRIYRYISLAAIIEYYESAPVIIIIDYNKTNL